MVWAWMTTVLVVALIAIVVTPWARRMGTPAGRIPSPQAVRRQWVGVAVVCTLSLGGVALMTWAIPAHHAALGVIGLFGMNLAANGVLFALRYRRHRQGTGYGDDEH